MVGIFVSNSHSWAVMGPELWSFLCFMLILIFTILDIFTMRAGQSMEYVLRPSSWPIRNERRHAAIINSKADICNKIDAMSSILASLIDTLQNTVSHLGEKINVVTQRLGPDAPALTDVDHRVTKLEMLLLRTSIKGFQCLDKEIIQMMLPKCTPHQPFHREPEL